MPKWKALLAVAFSVAVLALVAARTQQQGTNTSSDPSALTALDYLEIQQLVTRYAYALDSGAENGQLYAGLFAPDGEFVQRSGEAVSGREALINAFNDNGDTAVHRASGERIIRFLVANGAELNVPNKQRKTPLDVALERKGRNGAIRYPGAVAALRELTAAPTATKVSSRP